MKALTAILSLAALTVSASAALPQDGDRVARDAIDGTSVCAIGRKPPCTLKTAEARGLIETGLHPRFADGVKCRGIDTEKYAIDYTYKRNRPSRHGGIDMPAPFGTPIVAAAAGTVVGVYRGTKGHQGTHVILRHTPQDTGLPIYVYTVYAHLNKMPDLHVGQRVKMGDLIGPTGNSGATPGHRHGGGQGGEGRRRRHSGGQDGEGHRRRHHRDFAEGGSSADGGSGDTRFGHTYRIQGGGGGGGGHRGGGGGGGHHGVRRPALHFGVYYSDSPKYAALRGIVIPADAHWMDPVALFRKNPPFDSRSMRALPAAEKAVPIPYILPDGSVHPDGTKLIWPYRCKH
jgi:hypothetical protein